MVDIKHLLSVNCLCSPQQTAGVASLLSSECLIHQQSHSMEVWQEFWKAFNWRLFMFGLLVPVSDVTWQVSTHPPPAAGSSLRAGTKSFPSSQSLTKVIAGHRDVGNAFLCPASFSTAHALAGSIEILEALPEILPPCLQPSPSHAG